jgi:hypothetical protein
MKSAIICRCQSACKTKRCVCLKASKACTAGCMCVQCSNPFNRIENTDQLSDCARHHIRKVATLSAKELNQAYELPCCCEQATLKDLLVDYTCLECDAVCYYSFCMNEVMDANSMWHCHACGTCREDSEWHCKHCNQCTYGLTLECDNCGRKSPYMP